MNILILHRIPYHKINYHLGIDHRRHTVTYIGTEAALASLPGELPCRRIARPGLGPVYREVLQCLDSAPAHFDSVISLSEYELLDAAHVRQVLGVPGDSPQQVLTVRDKLQMKARVAAAGLPVPLAMSLEDWQAGCALSWHGRIVLKPVDGASSENVLIFDDEQSMRAYLVRHPLPHGQFEIEQFIDAGILHFDGLVVDGEVVLLVASQYIGSCLGYARGHALGSIQRPTAPGEAGWVAAVIRALAIEHGAFHLEAFAGEVQPIFLEIGHRVGGAEVAETVRLHTGIDLHQAWLHWLTEGVRPAIPPRAPWYYGWFVLPGHHLPPGPCRLRGQQPFANHPQVLRWQQLAADQPLPRHITYQGHEVPAAGIIRGANPGQLAELMHRILSEVHVEPMTEVPA
ncbi:ATP-grasp domain-containing protein [Paludibacterium purpuratum]|uniref:ATP-grasp domain-containing protein n=1 Tax=Paludibacterium purpuratum TaxID=1144873 RepID=A0A4R7B7A2_9NEIS|nr:ATP-grasp domain-containing protein [Paludibacterium purpuratum]TDR80581.1 hypothetical protein DFP86_10479 [Paludibacterium purpuratum]